MRSNALPILILLPATAGEIKLSRRRGSCHVEEIKVDKVVAEYAPEFDVPSIRGRRVR